MFTRRASQLIFAMSRRPLGGRQFRSPRGPNHTRSASSGRRAGLPASHTQPRGLQTGLSLRPLPEPRSRTLHRPRVEVKLLRLYDQIRSVGSVRSEFFVVSHEAEGKQQAPVQPVESFGGIPLGVFDGVRDKAQLAPAWP